MFATLMIAASAAPPARRLEERSAAPPARRLEESSVCTTLATQVCGEGGVSTLYGSVDGEQVCPDAGGCNVYGGSIIAQGSSYCNIFCDGGCSNDAIRSFVDTHDAGVMSLQCTGQAQLRAYVLMPLCWIIGTPHAAAASFACPGVPRALCPS